MAYKYLNDDGLKAYTKKVKGALKDLHTAIAISTENTTESKAQNVRNIADFIAKAKAAGIADVNGMAVTCLIDNDYSAVLAFYNDTGNSKAIYGVSVHDDPSEQFAIRISADGYYTETPLVTPQNTNIITSEMLTQGARKLIILTPNTTEVDEETYQKLISDDVDVVFKTDGGNYCVCTYKYEGGDAWCFTFTCFSREGESLSDTYFYGYEVRITKIGNPHQCEVIDHSIESQFSQILLDEGFTNRSFLSPVLQEIDLTGTDAERKDKLAHFEIYWKNLTGADNMIGARFVGKVDTPSGISTMVFTWNDSLPCYTGIGFDDTSRDYQGSVLSDGTLYIYPIFAHLEPITIKASSDEADFAANKAAINKYYNNLSMELGLGVYKGYQVSVVVISNDEEYVGTLNIGTGPLLMGIVTDVNETHHYPLHIEVATGIVTFDKNNYFIEKTSDEVNSIVALKRDLGTLSSLNTESKTDLVSAINELAGKVAALEANATEVTNETTE